MLTVGPTDDLATCRRLRRAVFIAEQGVSEADELDGRDADALHLLAYMDDNAVGTARILLDGDTGKIGRVCVLPDYRGQRIGVTLIEAAVAVLADQPGVNCAKLGAQTQAIGFYERLGFVPVGPEYMDAGIAHRDMIFKL